jgi:hypothetical protein
MSMAPFLIVIALPLVIGFHFVSVMLYPAAHRWGALRMRGAETTGIVTNKRSRLGTTTHYYIRYEFRISIRTIESSARVSEERWDALRVGDSIPVTYLPRLPQSSLPVARRDLSLENVFGEAPTWQFGLATLLLLVLIVLMNRIRRRQVRLLRNGNAVIATVTAINGQRVEYSFDTPSGLITSRWSYRGSVLPKPAAGDTFAILYDPDNPNMNGPWIAIRTLSEGTTPPEPPRTAGIIEPDLLARSLGPSTPARVRLSWKLYATFACLAIIAATPALRLGRALDVNHRLRILARGYRQIDGVVVRLSVIPEQSTRALRVHYRYAVPPKTFTSTYSVSSLRLQERFATGQITPVVYAINDPSVSLPLMDVDLHSEAVTANLMIDIVAMTTILLIIAAVMVHSIWRAVYEWRLASTGQLATARVEGTSGNLFRRCRYRFLSDHGDVEMNVRLLSKTFRANAGERIEVLYATSPLRSMPVADLLFIKLIP